jgi:putative effector of murein hydrolase
VNTSDQWRLNTSCTVLFAIKVATHVRAYQNYRGEKKYVNEFLDVIIVALPQTKVHLYKYLDTVCAERTVDSE